MASEARSAAATGWDGHILLLYSSETDRMAAFASWVRRGLENDEKVVCAGTDAQISDRSVLGPLAGHGIDVTAATAEGRLAVLAVPEFYPPGGQAEIVDQALAEGFRRVRIAARERAAAMYLSRRALAQRERALELLCQTRPISALCQYEQASAAGDRLAELVGSHRNIRQFQLSSHCANGGMALAGEVDISNDKLLEHALAAAASRVSGTLRLDISQVGFLGAAGCRALDVGTRQFRDGGGHVFLLAPVPSVEQILRIAGMDQLKHMEVVRGEQ